MRTFPQRGLAACFAVALGTLAGALGGYALGRLFALEQAQFRVEHSVERLNDDVTASMRESRNTFARLVSMPQPPCSDADIAALRQIIFLSPILKDAGRIRDGRIQCSATLGRDLPAQAELHPDFTEADGARVYRNLPLFRIPGHNVVTVSHGGVFVVYSPFDSPAVFSPHMHYTMTDVDAATHASGTLLGELPEVHGSVLTRSGQASLDGNLYATRCPMLGSLCVTAYMSVPEALAGSQPALTASTLLGVLAGGMLGFAGFLLYRRRKSLNRQLQRALRRDALHVVYQPIVDLDSGRIVEAEALARWVNEDGHHVSPDVFIKAAEERGFVSEITRLVIRRVLRDFGATFRQRPDFHINVNIAAADLADPAFLSMLSEALESADVSPQSLAFEITESYTARQQVAKETILKLRQRGHCVYIDDFGTGYSSLAYLHDLSIDAIKIDKAFTHAIGTDAVTVSIVPQILSMASRLDLRVVVEGIETPQQARYFAATTQSIRGQGWLFGRPVAADAFHQLLAGNDLRSKYAEEEESRLAGPAIVHVA